MKLKHGIILLSVIVLLFGAALRADAEKPSRSLTLIYSNNINGEIEPCPT